MPLAKYGELLGMENELRGAHPVPNPCCTVTLRACLPIIPWNGGGKLPQRLGQPCLLLSWTCQLLHLRIARKPIHREDVGLWIAARWPCSPNSTKKRSRVVLNHKALQRHSSGLWTEKPPPSWPLTLHGLWGFVLTLMGAALHLSGPLQWLTSGCPVPGTVYCSVGVILSQCGLWRQKASFALLLHTLHPKSAAAAKEAIQRWVYCVQLKPTSRQSTEKIP